MCTKEVKCEYIAPEVILLVVKPSYTLLESFSVNGDFEELEYAGEV